MNLVIDCSFIMSSILLDEEQLKVDNIYNQISNKIYNVFAPAIFFLECNNVLISSLKKQRITSSDYEEYLHLLNILHINIDKFCSSPESLRVIARIATKYGLIPIPEINFFWQFVRRSGAQILTYVFVRYGFALRVSFKFLKIN